MSDERIEEDYIVTVWPRHHDEPDVTICKGWNENDAIEVHRHHCHIGWFDVVGARVATPEEIEDAISKGAEDLRLDE